MRELGRNYPKTIDELMDVVANYVASEEVVGVFFSDGKDKGKARADDVESPSKGLEGSRWWARGG